VADESFRIDSTQVHPNVAWTYGTMWMLPSGPGAADVDMFLDSRPMESGLVFRGRVTRDRPFPLRLYVDLGSSAPSRPKGYQNWEDLLDLLSAEKGLVSFQHWRDDAVSGTVKRELLAQVIEEPPAAYVVGGDEPGIRPNGNILFETQCVAPFPWWRTVGGATDSIVVTGATPNDKAIARGGQLVCGVRISITTTGALSAMTVSDGVRSIVLTATFGASAKYVDWYCTDPTATEIGSGVTINRDAHISLHSDPTTITCTPNGGATGTHTVALTWYALWKSV